MLTEDERFEEAKEILELGIEENKDPMDMLEEISEIWDGDPFDLI